MADRALNANVAFRPHFKTHQSRDIGNIFRENGVSSITVSSIAMADYFSKDGWDDITIAFPLNVNAADRYDQLAHKGTLNSLVISPYAVEKLDKQLNEQMGLYIEIDPDYGRSGIPVHNIDSIHQLVKSIQSSEHFHFVGFYCHAGHTYKARNEKKITSIAAETLQKLESLKEYYPETDICYGDTPSCSVLKDFGPVTQISPGNFVFYDWMQVQIGSCTPNEIAVYMECPVIEKFEDRYEVLIHGGAVHFSKESISIEGILSYGEPRLKYLSKDTYIQSISQEHGIIHCSPEVFNSIEIGEMIQIFPIHSCLTADLMGSYQTTDGKKLDHMNGQKPT